MDNNWVKVTLMYGTSLADEGHEGPVVWVNLAQVTSMQRVENRGLPHTELHSIDMRVKETPEELIAQRRRL